MWLSVESLFEDAAGLGIWNRAELEPYTNRVRDSVPQAYNPNPAAVNRLKTHCPRGHPYDAENTYVRPSSGSRECRACKRDRKGNGC